ELHDPGDGIAGPLATLLDAVPVVVVDTTPGATEELPPLTPLIALGGPRGGIRAENAITIRLSAPEHTLRAAPWAAGLGDQAVASDLGARLRTTSGTIRRAASLARGEALLAGRSQPSERDVRLAMRSLEAEALETLATRVPVVGDWSDLAVTEETARE